MTPNLAALSYREGLEECLVSHPRQNGVDRGIQKYWTWGCQGSGHHKVLEGTGEACVGMGLGKNTIMLNIDRIERATMKGNKS